MFVAEIFGSFHGEVNGHHQGRMVTFIRLSGCNLRCPYCDTKATWDDRYGEFLTMNDILEKVKSIGNDYVCLTGGEPLLHTSLILGLLWALWDEGYHISVETNGTICVHPFFRYVESFVIDYKMNLVSDNEKYPATRIVSNFKGLRNTDVLKFLISTEEELIQAEYLMKQIIKEGRKDSNPIFAFSPLLPQMTPENLAELLIKHKVRNAVLSLQIHKFVGFK